MRLTLVKKYGTAILLILCIASFGAAFSFIFYHKHHKQADENNAQENARIKTEKTARELNRFVNHLKKAVVPLAEKLNNAKLSKNEIEKELGKKPIEVSGLGIAFAPHMFNPKEKLYAPYYLEIEGKQELVELDYDYTNAEYTWFNKPLTQGPTFLSPFVYRENEKILLQFAIPFYTTDKKTGIKSPGGIVFAHQSREHFDHLLSTLFLGQSGYWFILAEDGTILLHPNQNYTDEHITIGELAEKINTSSLKDIGTQTPKGFISYNNELTGASSYLFFQPIEATQWTLCGVFDKSELTNNTDLLKQNYLHILLSILAFIIFLTCLLLLHRVITLTNVWLASFCISAALAASIGSIWFLVGRYPSYKENLRIIESKVDLYNFIDSVSSKQKQSPVEQEQKETIPELDEEELSEEMVRQLTYRYSNGIYIPTGIFISDITFNQPTVIDLVGFIWQRYSIDQHKDIERGFILPQASDAEISELYRSNDGNTETVLWQVKATLNQEFSYEDYPFDVKDFQVQIWHKDFEKNVMLVPDLNSYNLINPRSLPGLSEFAHLSGWRLEKSYFGYKTNTYNSRFGLYAYGPFGIYKKIDKSSMPELYFNVTGKRYLIDTIVGDLLPIAVIAILLFVILLTSVAQGYAVFGSYASVFFGLAFAQFRFRSKIPGYQLVYFENLYLVLYATILILAIVSILYVLPIKIQAIQYRKNLIAKLLYWPILLGAVLCITLAYLY